MSTPLVLALVLAVVIPVRLYRAYHPGDASVERWADGHGLALTSANRPLVIGYLRNARVLRTWGAVAGALLPSLIELAWSGRLQVLGFGADGESAPLSFGTILVGYLIGALGAELSLVRPVARGRRMASLERRELGHYLPRRVILAQRAATAAGALGALAIGLVPYAGSVSAPSPAQCAIGALAVIVFGTGLEAIERWLVRRPQPFTNPQLVAADDAIRAHSIHALAGAALGLLLLCTGVALVLQASDVQLLRATMALPAAACLLLALFACSHVAGASWHVRRPAGAGDSVST